MRNYNALFFHLQFIIPFPNFFSNVYEMQSHIAHIYFLYRIPCVKHQEYKGEY